MYWSCRRLFKPWSRKIWQYFILSPPPLGASPLRGPRTSGALCYFCSFLALGVDLALGDARATSSVFRNRWERGDSTQFLKLLMVLLRKKQHRPKFSRGAALYTELRANLDFSGVRLVQQVVVEGDDDDIDHLWSKEQCLAYRSHSGFMSVDQYEKERLTQLHWSGGTTNFVESRQIGPEFQSLHLPRGGVRDLLENISDRDAMLPQPSSTQKNRSPLARELDSRSHSPEDTLSSHTRAREPRGGPTAREFTRIKSHSILKTIRQTADERGSFGQSDFPPMVS
jgi:hypothetical protein